MDAVNPTPEQLQKVLADTPKDQPVVMLNLLRFRDRANYKEEAPERTVREAYSLYMEEAAACVRSVGAEVIWSSRSVGSLIAPRMNPGTRYCWFATRQSMPSWP